LAVTKITVEAITAAMVAGTILRLP